MRRQLSTVVVGDSVIHMLSTEMARHDGDCHQVFFERYFAELGMMDFCK